MIKTIKKKKSDDGLLKIFNQMTGVEDPDPVIIEKKYENFLHYMQNVIKAWSIFLNSDFGCNFFKNKLPARWNEIYNFVLSGKEFLEQVTLPVNENKFKTNRFSDSLEQDMKEILVKYDPELLIINYKLIKNSALRIHITNTLTNLLNLLQEHSKLNKRIINCLDDKNNLSNKFFTETQLDTKMLSFSTLDFQYLYNICSDNVKEFDSMLLFVLHVTYCSGLEVRKLMFSPDINIAEFVKAFAKRLDETSKHIPGCTQAFKCLKKSLWMLEKNFDDYYMQYIATDNPNIIFECFLKDVSQKVKKGTVTMQFSKIVEHVKKNMSEQQKANPVVKKLFQASDKIFEQFRRTESVSEPVSETETE